MSIKQLVTMKEPFDLSGLLDELGQVEIEGGVKEDDTIRYRIGCGWADCKTYCMPHNPA